MPKHLPILAVIPIVSALLASTAQAYIDEAGGDSPEMRWGGDSSWDIPGEYVVDFHDDVERSTIAELMKSLGLSFTDTVLSTRRASSL